MTPPKQNNQSVTSQESIRITGYFMYGRFWTERQFNSIYSYHRRMTDRREGSA